MKYLTGGLLLVAVVTTIATFPMELFILLQLHPGIRVYSHVLNFLTDSGVPYTLATTSMALFCVYSVAACWSIVLFTVIMMLAYVKHQSEYLLAMQESW